MGVIGPMRIDYKKIIPYIEYLTGKITEILSTETKETQEENDTFDTDLSNNDSDSEGDI